MSREIDAAVLEEFRTQDGLTLGERQRRSPVVVVFLRHMGCPFCRETLADLSGRLGSLRSRGVDVVVVHMSDEALAGEVFAKLRVADVPRISDPARKLYKAFKLGSGSLLQIAGPRVMLRGLGTVLRHGLGVPQANVRQLPGTFLIRNGTVLSEFRHKTSADRPDYESLLHNAGIA